MMRTNRSELKNESDSFEFKIIDLIFFIFLFLSFFFDLNATKLFFIS